LELALRAALDLSHNYIGTEHLLLGLLAEGESVGIRALTAAGVQPDQLRNDIQTWHDAGPP
jgi:ATP-dependent Clp protease ATP-binding subunit ClpC